MSDQEQDRSIATSREATDWLIRLQEDPGDTDLRHRFETWLAESRDNATAWAVTRHAANLIAVTSPVHEAQRRPCLADLGADAARPAMSKHPRDDADDRHRSPAGEPDGRRSWKRHPQPRWCLGLGLSGLALVGFVMALLLPSLLLQWQADHTTATAQQKTLTLKDGSRIVMAPETALSVHYSATDRHIRLLAGTAFFTVSHEADRPFRVTAGDIETLDLGTAFVVGRSGTGVRIGVTQGSVQVDLNDAATPVAETLTRGQTVTVSWSGVAVRGETPPNQIAAWRSNRLIARDQPLGKVVKQLRPYFTGSIVITDRQLAVRTVTGVFDLDDPENALRGLAEAHGAKVHRITPWLVLVSSG